MVESQGFSICSLKIDIYIYTMAKKCFTFPASWAQLLPYNNIWYVFFPYFTQLSANVFAVCSLCYISLFGWIFFLSFGESIWVLIFSALSLKMSLLVLPKHKLSSQVTGVKVYCLSTTCSKLTLQKISYITNKFSILMLGLRYWGVISR